MAMKAIAQTPMASMRREYHRAMAPPKLRRGETVAMTSSSSSSREADSDAPYFPLLPDGSSEKVASPVSQRRVFDQMIELRTRLNERVAKTTAFSKHVEETLAKRDAQLVEARQALRRAMLEAETLKILAQDALVAIERGDGNDERSKRRMETLRGRLERVHKTLREDEALTDAGCLRTVPITWTGNANDVQLMGDFDNWSRGIRLSPEYYEGGTTTTQFTCDVALPPGEYQVKFLVDGSWRTTDDWPGVGEGLERNNILRV